jgi:hypothetical protein
LIPTILRSPRFLSGRSRKKGSLRNRACKLIYKKFLSLNVPDRMPHCHWRASQRHFITRVCSTGPSRA